MRTALVSIIALAAFAASPALAQDEPRDDWSLSPRGRIQYDLGHVDAPDAIGVDGLGTVDEFRAIRAGIQGRIAGLFDYVLEVDVSQNDLALTDATLAYDTGPVALVFGHQKTFSGLDELTSARFTSLIERAAFTDAFGFERRVGLAVFHESDSYSVGAGVFTDDFDSLTDDANDGYSLDGRFVWHPAIGERTRLHLGGSVHWRDIRRTDTLRYRQRPLIHATDVRFISTPELPVEEERSYGVEAAVVRGPFHAAAEAHWLRPSLAGGLATPSFFGGYVEAGWFVTRGDTRGYRNGRFDRVRPERPVGEGGIGAVQLNVRYDYLDLDGARILGGSQQLVGGSLIWTPRDDLRLMLNGATIVYENAAVPAAGDRDYDVRVIALRAQFDF